MSQNERLEEFEQPGKPDKDERSAAKGKRRSGFLSNYLKVKIAAGVLAVAALAAVALGISRGVFFGGKTTKIGFENIGELATQSAYCTQIEVTDASREFYGITIPFTQSKYIYSYDILIKAGFDFGEIEWAVDEEAAVIEVFLPEARILSSEIDLESFQLYHEEESIFREITMEENNAALVEMQRRAEEDAAANGLLENARGNAELILKGFFAGAYDLTEYTIKFTDK